VPGDVAAGVLDNPGRPAGATGAHGEHGEHGDGDPGAVRRSRRRGGSATAAAAAGLLEDRDQRGGERERRDHPDAERVGPVLAQEVEGRVHREAEERGDHPEDQHHGDRRPPAGLRPVPPRALEAQVDGAELDQVAVAQLVRADDPVVVDPGAVARAEVDDGHPGAVVVQPRMLPAQRLVGDDDAAGRGAADRVGADRERDPVPLPRSTRDDGEGDGLS
jgi:hypothetical protein